MRTLKELLKYGEDALLSRNIPNGRMEAWYLLEYICGIRRVEYLMAPDSEADVQEERRYINCINERILRKPLQYIMHTASFMGFDFMVTPSVLIPRQDTEILVETILPFIYSEDMEILDMCTGSGCILLSLMKLSGVKKGTGADISSDALDVARMNGIFLQMDGASWIQSDLFEKICGKYDIIVSNPPYIPTEIIDGLMPEVKDYEPKLALDGEADGLAFYRRIINDCEGFLKPGGMLFFEIGCEQGEAVEGLMGAAHFESIHRVKDLTGLDRVVYGSRI